MRLRLAQTVSLLLVSVVAVAMLAVVGLLAWNLRSGFDDYLKAGDADALERFADLVGRRCAELGGATALTDGRIDGSALLRTLAVVGAGPTPPSSPTDQRGPPGPRPPPGPPPGEALMPLPAGGPAEFPQRASIYLRDGSFIQGNPTPSGVPYEHRPVLLNGTKIAEVRLLPRPSIPTSVEATFLQRQYRTMILAAGVLLAAALLVAGLVARQWVRPLLEIRAATTRIARGEHTVRLTDTRGDEIGDVMRAVNRMTEDLARLEDARRRWIAEIAHELRTPIAILRGELEALEDGVRPLAQGAIASLRDEVLRLGSLVEDLHLLALSDLKALPYHPESVDAGELLERTVSRFQKRAEAQDLTLAYEPPLSEPPQLEVDARRIEQVLGNLLDNSFKYTDSPGAIRIALRSIAGTVDISVEDTPPGIPEDEVERIFDPLYRLDPARRRATGGSGLGLAICRAIVTAHGGSIEAYPSSLGGLGITIRLPAAKDQKHDL
jgi:two-component system sensor histidine kinase BaeS